MAEHIHVAQQKIEEFERTRSLDALTSAVQSLERIEKPEPSQAPPPEVRSRGALAWITIFRHIDQNLDPNFDPTDVPSVNIVPPATSSGVKYPSGVDPKAIPDPQARAQYKQRLNENVAKGEQYSFQDRLRRVDERALEGFHQYAKHFFAAGRPESAELRRLLDGAPLEAGRKKQLAERLAK